MFSTPSICPAASLSEASLQRIELGITCVDVDVMMCFQFGGDGRRNGCSSRNLLWLPFHRLRSCFVRTMRSRAETVSYRS